MKRETLKSHCRRARLKETAYGLVIDACDIVLGLMLIWGPFVMTVVAGVMIRWLGW